MPTNSDTAPNNAPPNTTGGALPSHHIGILNAAFIGILNAGQHALTGGEARMLLAAGRGEALLLAGSHRVAFQTVASTREHELAAGLADLIDESDL